MGINWIDHGVDFWVIFFADIGAAYVAIKIFESRNADRERTEASLSLLYQLSTRKRDRFWHQRAGVTTHDHLEARIANDVTEMDAAFEDLRDNFIFWNFKRAALFREQYDKIRTQKDRIHRAQPAGELKQNLNVLIEQLDALKNDIESELRAKKSWWWIRR